MVTMQDDVIFFEAASPPQLTHKIVFLAIGNDRLETVLKEKLAELYQDFEAYSVRDLSTLQERLAQVDHVDLVITLRSNAQGGVLQSLEIIQSVKSTFALAEGIVIVGNEDDEGKKLLTKAKRSKIRTVSGERVSISQIEQEMKQVIEKWGVKEKVGQIIHVEAAKGGSGATSFIAQLAVSLATEGKRALIVDQKKGVHFWFGVQLGTKVKLTPSIDLIHNYELIGHETTNYDYILVDGNSVEGKDHHILILDPSEEAIGKAKGKIEARTKIILNQALPQIMAKEVIEHEIDHPIQMVIEHDREAYMLALASHKPNPIPDFNLLLD
ncbi:MAG TPA: hypothetical protein VJ824_15945 [Bacillota bacterium]|nr:hypothetical protein [Bacillota bacterium]